MTTPIYELGDLVTIRKGKKAVEVSESPSEGFLRYIQIEDLRNNDSMKYARNPKGPICDENDVLIAWDGAKAGTIGFGLSGLVGSTIAILRPNESVYAPYLGMVLQSKYQMIRDACTGATIPHVSKPFLLRMNIPLPSIPEQKRIAAILDKADEIKQTSKDLNSSKYDVLQSYFVEIFGDPSVRDRWPSHSIGEIADDVQYGTAKKANEDGFGIPVLRMNNLTEEGFINLDSLKHCELEDTELSKFTVSKFDILFNRTNSPKLVGKTSFWLFDENYSFAGYLIRVRLNQEIIDPYYLWTYMNSAYCKAFLFQKAKASNNMSNFSGGELKKMVVPVPPKPLQMKFRKLVENTMQGWELIDSIEDFSSTLVDSLRQEILA